MPTFIKRPHVSTYGEIKNVMTETAITQDNTGKIGTTTYGTTTDITNNEGKHAPIDDKWATIAQGYSLFNANTADVVATYGTDVNALETTNPFKPSMKACYAFSGQDATATGGNYCVPDINSSVLTGAAKDRCMACADIEDPPGSGCTLDEPSCVGNYEIAPRAGATLPQDITVDGGTNEATFDIVV